MTPEQKRQERVRRERDKAVKRLGREFQFKPEGETSERVYLHTHDNGGCRRKADGAVGGYELIGADEGYAVGFHCSTEEQVRGLLEKARELGVLSRV